MIGYTDTHEEDDEAGTDRYCKPMRLLEGLELIKPEEHSDNRGRFLESFNAKVHTNLCSG